MTEQEDTNVTDTTVLADDQGQQPIGDESAQGVLQEEDSQEFVAPTIGQDHSKIPQTIVDWVQENGIDEDVSRILSPWSRYFDSLFRRDASAEGQRSYSGSARPLTRESIVNGLEGSRAFAQDRYDMADTDKELGYYEQEIAVFDKALARLAEQGALQSLSGTESMSADKEIAAEAPSITREARAALLTDQRPHHDYREEDGRFTQVLREEIHTPAATDALTLADVNKWTNLDIPITVGTKNPTGVTSGGGYKGALSYDWMEAQGGEGFVTSVPIPRTNPPRARRLVSDGGRAKVISGYVGDAHPTGVGFHNYHALREGIAAGVDNFSSLYERTNRTRRYTYQDAQGQTHEVVLENEGIKNVRDLAYVWTATGQPNRFRVFTTAIELTDSSLGKDDEGIEKVDANDLRQSFVITLTSTGVEAGDDGVIEHIRQITGYNAANPTAALATFKEEFQEGMKMATDAGPGRRLVNGAWTGRGRGTNAHSIWKAETVDAFFADVNFTTEDGHLYVTMPNRAGTGIIRLRWGVTPSAEGA